MRPTQFTTKTVHEVFIDGSVPGEDTTKVGMQVIPNPAAPPDAPESSSTRWVVWVEGCAGTPADNRRPRSRRCRARATRTGNSGTRTG